MTVEVVIVLDEILLQLNSFNKTPDQLHDALMPLIKKLNNHLYCVAQPDIQIKVSELWHKLLIQGTSEDRSDPKLISVQVKTIKECITHCFFVDVILPNGKTLFFDLADHRADICLRLLIAKLNQKGKLQDILAVRPLFEHPVNDTIDSFDIYEYLSLKLKIYSMDRSSPLHKRIFHPALFILTLGLCRIFSRELGLFNISHKFDSKFIPFDQERAILVDYNNLTIFDLMQLMPKHQNMDTKRQRLAYNGS